MQIRVCSRFGLIRTQCINSNCVPSWNFQLRVNSVRYEIFIEVSCEGMIKLEDVNEIIGGHDDTVTFVPPKVQ